MPTKGQRKYNFPINKECLYCGGLFAVTTCAQLRCRKFCDTHRWESIRALRKASARPVSEHAGKVEVTCAYCESRFFRQRIEVNKAEASVCSRRCNGHMLRLRALASMTPEDHARIRERMTGPNNPNWKGGLYAAGGKGLYKGGLYVRCPKAFRSWGYSTGSILQHRLLVGICLRRKLHPKEIVHHLDQNPHNNRIDNLVLFATQGDHKRYEFCGKPEPIWDGRDVVKLIDAGLLDLTWTPDRN